MSAGTGTQPASSAGGATQIIGATIIAGIAGYLVTFLVYRVVGPAPYALFAIFWASLYLGVGALSGIQQEVTRATHPIDPGSRHGANRARAFGVVAAVLVFVATIASAVLWVDAVFPADGWALVWPLAVGASAYVLVATLSGSLYGVSQWRSLALMISLDGVLRLALVGAILTTSNDIVALAWAVALPFPLAIMLLWPVIRRTFIGRSDIDVGYGRLTWNVARTVLAAVSTAVLVSAFPLLLGVTARGADAALIGELVFTLTLTRAPLVVSVMALQSYFIVQFRQRLEHWAGFLLKVMGVLAAGGVLLALAGWWLGPPVFELVSGAPVTLDGGFIAVMVASSALVGALSVSGSAVLGRGGHLAYSAGWLVAALATVIIMALPIDDILLRVGAATVAAPLLGLAVHAVWLAATARRTPAVTAFGGEAL
jgi:O-antigen/teichoic acid export membrane protein